CASPDCSGIFCFGYYGLRSW
nr:immunoglobulin heavy chain junction region [Macaca mulatta]MOW45629.1 immunoglobulin heavy chain junction region [Macaca mulatta]MOW45647.1 immunoglobulin heavy chain junction region [Macaca mulatta]MOW45660.1 immunoglobulin heavy chain junction region [Macaca mulatta]MOW45664.1 immunoglobulin heavy chain junction region [Macaca mulatta]